MRKINLIVIHCSATRCNRPYTEADLTADHLRRGFSEAGYHYYVRLNGDIKNLRPVVRPGIHSKKLVILKTKIYLVYNISWKITL